MPGATWEDWVCVTVVGMAVLPAGVFGILVIPAPWASVSGCP